MKIKAIYPGELHKEFAIAHGFNRVVRTIFGELFTLHKDVEVCINGIFSKESIHFCNVVEAHNIQ
jgi:hypothetical protein